MSHAAALWISLALLLGNAFFVGAEFATMTARRSTLEPLAEAGNARARVCLRATEEMGAMLTTAQLGITVCSVGIGALAESALHEIFAGAFAALGLQQRYGVSNAWIAPLSLAVALLIVVYLHVTVGEMIPKNLAIAGPDRAALLLVPPLHLVSRALRPVVWLVTKLAKGVVRLMGIEPQDEIANAFTAEEVSHIAAESGAEGLLPVERQGMLRSAIEFADVLADQVAVPLDRLITVSWGVTPDQIEQLVGEHGFSRYPVKDATGEVAGYLHLKDVLADEGRRHQPVPFARIRRLATVGPHDEIEDVLATMQRSGAHLARVADDGEITGIVFLEDILEELVGPFEPDPESPPASVPGPGDTEGVGGDDA